MQNDTNKSLNMVHEIIMKKFHPAQWEAEQAEKAKALAETLAFVEGIKAVLAAQEQEAAKGVLFKSDKSSPCGFIKSK